MGDEYFWIWVAGICVAGFSGIATTLLVIIYQGLQNQVSEIKKGVKNMGEEIKEVSGEREEKCIPRKECERTHAAVNDTLREIKQLLAVGFKEVNSQIKDVHARVDEVHERVNEANISFSQPYGHKGGKGRRG